MGQQGLLLPGGQAAGHRGQQGLGHRVVALRLHPVEIHPLVGGVLVDEVHRLPLLHDDIGVQHLSGQPPGLLLGEEGGGIRGGGALRGIRAAAGRPYGGIPDGRADDIRPYGLCALRGFRAATGRPYGGIRDGRADGIRPYGLCALWDADWSGPRPYGRYILGGPSHILHSAFRILHSIRVVLDPDLGGHGQPGLVGRDGVLRLPAPHRLILHSAFCILHFYRRVAPILLQGGEDGVVHRREHLPLVAELDLGLGWVDVHVHGVELCLQVEDTAGEFAHHFLIFVGLLQGGHHDSGLHLAAVDEEELPVAAAPAAGGEGDEAGDGHVLSAGLHRSEAQGQLPAQDGVDGAL